MSAGYGAPQPPDTGGNTATSSRSKTGVSPFAGSPFTQTRQIARTAANDDPNSVQAAASTSSTVPPAMTARLTPAASRALAKSRRTATNVHLTDAMASTVIFHDLNAHSSRASWSIHMERHGEMAGSGRPAAFPARPATGGASSDASRHGGSRGCQPTRAR